MSSSEILAELPRLTHEERRAICQKIITLEAEQGDLDSCRQAAITGFQLLEQKKNDARRGDVWMMDLGIAAKVRPCLLLTNFSTVEELVLGTIIPQLTALKGNQWELKMNLPYLREGAFHLQQIQSFPINALLRRFGVLSDADYEKILGKLASGSPFENFL